MARSGLVTEAESLAARDKFKRQKSAKQGVYVYPPAGFLGAGVGSHPPLLKCGGIVNNVTCCVVPGRQVQVLVSGTCTVDNVLTALSFRYNSEPSFRLAITSFSPS